MRIHTSYFAMNNYILWEGMIPVVISTSVPFWNDAFILYHKLYPTNDMLWEYKHGKITEQEYIKKYRNNILAKLDPHEIYKELMELSEGKPVCLMCWEKSGKFCHRHIVAEWLREAGYLVSEYSI